MDKTEWISATEAAKRLSTNYQKLNQLAVQGHVQKRLTDAKFPWPLIKEQYEKWMGNRREQVVYTNGNLDQQIADSLNNNGQSPAPDIDNSDIAVMDQKQVAVDYNNLSVGEQIIMAIQNRTKGAEGTAYAWSRALKEAIGARSAMLELLEQEGKTLKREEVETWLYTVSRHNRDIWLNWPQLVANEIAEELNVDANLLYGILIRLVRVNLDRIATLPSEFGQHSASSVSEGAEATGDTAA